MFISNVMITSYKYPLNVGGGNLETGISAIIELMQECEGSKVQFNDKTINNN